MEIFPDQIMSNGLKYCTNTLYVFVYMCVYELQDTIHTLTLKEILISIKIYVYIYIYLNSSFPVLFFLFTKTQPFNLLTEV